MGTGKKMPIKKDSQSKGTQRKRRLNTQGSVLIAIVAALVVVAGFMFIKPILLPTLPEDNGQPAVTSVSTTETQQTRVTEDASLATETPTTVSSESVAGSDATAGEGDDEPVTEGSDTNFSPYRPILDHFADPIGQIGNRLVPRLYPHPLIIEPARTDLFSLASLEENHGVAGLYAEDNEDFRSAQVYLMDYEDEEPLYVQNARDRAWPASLTKILTIIVMLEEQPDLDQTVTITQEYVSEMARLNASTAGFSVGEKVSYRDLAYAAMLPSAGEAAYAIATDLGGSEAAFAEMMNEYAVKIGMSRSNFTNSTGLHDDNQYSTAEDLAILLRHSWENEVFRAMASQASYTTQATDYHPSGISFQHTVLSVVDRYPHDGFTVLGGKSGYTIVGGQCWATVVEADGDLYVAITLGSRTAEGEMSSPCYDTFKLMSAVGES